MKCNKFIEVIGIPGSGKSFFSKNIIDYKLSNLKLISQNLNNFEKLDLYKLYFFNEGNKFLEFIKFNCPSYLLKKYINLRQKIQSKNYILDKKWLKFYFFILKKINSLGNNSYEIKKEYIKFLSDMFFNINSNSNKTIIQDGGFLFKSSYFINYDNQTNDYYDSDFIQKYISLVPRSPNCVIWIKINPELALDRIYNRKKIINPFFLRDCKNNLEKINKLKKLDRFLGILIKKTFCKKNIILVDGNLNINSNSFRRSMRSYALQLNNFL
jgi:hypothetical protein